MHKTTVIIHGGLGNQLFQFFFALKIVNNNKKFLRVILPKVKQSNNLDIFDILEKKSLSNLEIIRINLFFYRIISKIRIIPAYLLSYLKIQTDDNLIYNPKKLKNPFLIYGYFQSLSLILKNEQIQAYLKKDFKRNYINKKNQRLGVHIRRGDYLSKVHNSTHGFIPIQYIVKKFIDLFRDIDQIFIYSDGDVKEELLNYLNYYLGNSLINRKKFFFSYNSGMSDKDVFYDMGKNKYLICSNSTFSFWASYLSKEVEYIYLPKQWYKNKKISNNLIHSRVKLY